MKIVYQILLFVSLMLFKVSVLFAAAPTAPSALVATASNAKVSLTWVASTGTGTITYSVQRTTDPTTIAYANIKTSLTTNSYVDTTAIINDKAYFYRVIAYNSGGSSPISNEAKGIPIPPPSVPSSLAATTTTDGKVALTWYASTGSPSGPITYTIRRALASNLIYSDIDTVSSLAYKDASAVSGTKYSYVVQSKNYGGKSASSTAVSITTGTITKPAVPTAVVATVVGDKKVELSWKASVAGGSVTYSIYRSLYSNFSTYNTLRTGLASLSYVDTTIPNKATVYYYNVKAINSLGTSLSSNISSVNVGSASMLFKTSFGSGTDVVLNLPSSIIDSQAWQTFSGTDTATGYNFPFIPGLGSGAELKLQLLGPYSYNGVKLNATNVSTYFGNQIQSATGPKGGPVHELFIDLKQKDNPVGQGGSQVPLLINRPWTIGDTGDVYISYWYKLPGDLPSKLDAFVSSGNWRTMFEWKTGGYNNTYAGDYRMKTNILKGKDGSLYWSSGWDNNANMTDKTSPPDLNKDGSTWEYKSFWSEPNYTVPVPLGKWFKFEVFWHRSNSGDGRYWVAVNGQTITNHYGANMGDYGFPINRIMINNAYTGGLGPVEGHLTDLHIWNGFPCGPGISCH